MRLLVVGAGATGGYFGGRLVEAGRDVTFLVRPARAETLRASGLQILSPHGDVTLRPKLVTAGNLAGPFDVILLAVKAYALHAALGDLAPAVGPDTVILPVLNGMRHMDILAARFGEKAVIGGVCKIASLVDDDGRIVQLAKFHELSYGERDATASPRTEALDAFMQGAGFTARHSLTIEREMWEKWLLLAGLGGVTCLMRGTVGEIVAAPGGTAFVHRLLDDVVAAITAVGTPPSPEAVAGVRTMLTTQGSAHTSSMYRDLQKGNPVEAEQIIGDLLMRAQAAGLATPMLAAAYTSLWVYQSRLAA